MALQINSKAVRTIALTGIALAFGVAYTQNPLYSANQNTYFLHGLKTTGSGLLANDWMANTVDPFPVFSWLVRFTAVHLSPVAFHCYQAILLALYFLGILGIACKSFNIKWSSTQFLACSFLLIGLHSAALADISLGMSGKNLVLLADVGVAQQSLISHELTPSTFGVFLILSIYAFVLQRPYLAVALSALAAIFHGSYGLSATILTLIYAAVIIKREGNMAKPALVGLLGFALLLPVLVFALQSFPPTSPWLFAQAETILAHFRIPQHAEPGRWFNLQAVVMLLVILSAIYLARNKAVFPVLSLGLVAGAFLTGLQIVASSDTLALLFPWRVSTWLVPVSWGMVVAAATSSLFARDRWAGWVRENRRAVDLGILLLIVSLAGYGGWKMYARSAMPPSIDRGESMMRFVSTSAKPEQVYLVPTEMEQFRLSTGAPIVVDWKTNPYKDTEVIEWYQRLSSARRFYGADGDSARAILRDLQLRYGVTHVVLRSHPAMPSYPEWHEVYSDSAYRVFRIDPAQSRALPADLQQ